MDKSKLIFIGLPGAGKSTLCKCIAEKENLKYISTDEKFRYYRSVPLYSEKNNEVIQNFLERIKTEEPEKYERLKAHAIMGELSDSKIFRSFSEDTFRKFEIELLKYLSATGAFKNTMVDISASAILYQENRALLSIKNGYVKVFLDTAEDIILERLIKDYNQHINDGRIIRGAYEITVKEGLEKGTSLEKSLLEKHRFDRKHWHQAYSKYSDIIINISEDLNIEENSKQIIDMIEYKLKNL